MATQKPNIGTGPDTGTGDDLRAAFTKVHSNAGLQDQLQGAVGVPEGNSVIGELPTDEGDPGGPVPSPATGADLAELDHANTDSLLLAYQKLRRKADRLGNAESLTLKDRNGNDVPVVVQPDGSLSVGNGPRIEPPRPAPMGAGMRRLWAIGRHDQSPGTSIPTQGIRSEARAANYFVASQCVPRDFFRDAGTLHLKASGSFLPDSADPRLIPGIAMGSRENPTHLRAPAAQVRSDLFGGALADIDPGGIAQVGIMTVGENALDREPGEIVDWDLDVAVYIYGRDGDGRIPDVAGTDVNIRVVGTLRWGELRDGVQHGEGPVVVTRNRTWSPERYNGQAEFPRLQEVTHHGGEYRAIAPIALAAEDALGTAETDLAAAADVAAIKAALVPLMERLKTDRDSEPGTRNSRQYWYKRVESMQIDFTQQVDLLEPNLWIHFTMGGPWQTDVTITPPVWTDATTYQRADIGELNGTADDHPDLEGMCRYDDGTGTERTFAARRDHLSSPSTAPAFDTDPDGEWNREWRQLGPTRQDRCMVHATTCYAVAGTQGITDAPYGR